MEKKEIKFRVWDKIRKQMVILDYLWLCNEYNSLCFSKEKWKHKYESKPIEEWPLEMDEDPDHFEIMQYTGLKDKNGIEIYEGDILKHPKISELLPWLISYYDGGVVLQNMGFDNYLYSDKIPLHQNSCSEREIIGNIYENTKI